MTIKKFIYKIKWRLGSLFYMWIRYRYYPWQLTCWKCLRLLFWKCEWSYDGYNTNGDCIAEK